MSEEEKPCPICKLGEDDPKSAKALSELLSFVSNGTAAFFLSKATGENIPARDVEKHKKEHAGLLEKPFSGIPRQWEKLDFSRFEDQAAAFNLDALHSLALAPGRTSPYVAMQGIKMLMDAADKKKSDAGDMISNIFTIVLKTVTNEEDKQRVADALTRWQKEQDQTQ